MQLLPVYSLVIEGSTKLYCSPWMWYKFLPSNTLDVVSVQSLCCIQFFAAHGLQHMRLVLHLILELPQAHVH